MSGDVERLHALVHGAGRIVVFSGAGISTESGIPDFRGPGGVWSRYDPSEFTIQNFLASAESRRRYWLRSTEMYAQIRESRPNAAHEAVAALEHMGRLGAVITQNVDGLHQQAGNSSERVIELHGTSREVACLACGRRHPRDEFQPRVSAAGDAPDCECGGLYKPATISFGQALEPAVLERAAAEVERCDLFLVIGSSLVVYPAAGFPLVAAERGVPLAIVNLQETPHDDRAEVVLREKAGSILPGIVETLPLPTPMAT